MFNVLLTVAADPARNGAVGEGRGMGAIRRFIRSRAAACRGRYSHTIGVPSQYAVAISKQAHGTPLLSVVRSLVRNFNLVADPCRSIPVSVSCARVCIHSSERPAPTSFVFMQTRVQYSDFLICENVVRRVNT